jgi:hypothetical protein
MTAALHCQQLIRYWAPGDVWCAPIGGGFALVCGVGFPLRVAKMPRHTSSARLPMPCDLAGASTGGG